MGFSVPAELAARVERIAREEGRSKSELFRAMVRLYESQRGIAAFEEVAEYGRGRARERGVRSEADVDRLIHEARGNAPRP